MAMTMLGMIVLAPAIGVWMTPLFEGFYNAFGIDPSIIPAAILANDMGGAPLATEICKSADIGNFNAYVVSSMMGCVISFTIPFSLGVVRREQHKDLFLGMLCGIATIPVGCFVGGLVCGIGPLALLLDLLPLIIFAVIIAVALVCVPKICVKCFSVFGVFMKILPAIGLMCAIFTYLTGIEVNEHFDTFDNGALACARACVTLSGALPFVTVVSRLLDKPLNWLGGKIGINSIAAVSLVASLATNASAFGVMDKMDRKGVVLNSAFAVSAAFVLASHLGYTVSRNADLVVPMMVGKLVAGVCAVTLAFLIYRDDTAKAEEGFISQSA